MGRYCKNQNCDEYKWSYMNDRKVKQAVILAGGLGTRLKPFTDCAPKPMFPIQGVPFIEYLLKQIKRFGINEVLILLGYMPEAIMDYLGDGEKYGIDIKYSVTSADNETALRLKLAERELHEVFLLMYCDNYCPIDFDRLCREYCQNDAMIQISAYSNTDGYSRSNLKIASNGRIEVYDKKRLDSDLQGVDIGYSIVNRKTVELLGKKNVNFEAEVFPLLVKEKKLYATVTDHRYYSIGSYERIELTKKFFEGKKFVFLDRDGTINVKPPKAHYIDRPEDFVWLPKAREAVKLLKDKGYFIILVTNQAGIARKVITEETLSHIHSKMQADLKEIGACIDKIYVCPHDWDEGCSCRKPKPGMLFQAQKEFSLNLTECVLIGDDERDIAAGKAAGCITYKVDEHNDLYEIVKEIV